MTPEWIAAISSLLTFFVIGASAVAALIQLHHIKSSNELVAINDFRQALESERFQAAIKQIQLQVPTLIASPDFRRRLANADSLREMEELESFIIVANLFETFGGFVMHGMIDRDLVCQLWGRVIRPVWRMMAPLVANIRVAMESPTTWEAFEYLAVTAQDFNAAHPKGSYPRGVRRAAPEAIWEELRRPAAATE